jgi:hypothetical protein
MRRVVLAVAALAVAVGAPAALAAHAAKTELYAELTGAAETPPGAPNGRGSAEVVLDPATGRVCWEFTGLRGLEGKPVAAHIHKGKAGATGDVVVAFTDGYRREGCTTAPKKVIRAILRNPGNYYVNLHTKKYPAGVVRGQLERAEE